MDAAKKKRRPRLLTRKSVYTCGEVAKICQAAPRTVGKWFDSGELTGWRIPGSNDRRVSRDSLMRFLKKHNMLACLTLCEREAGHCVLVVTADPHMIGVLRLDLATSALCDFAQTLFEAGRMTAGAPYGVVVVCESIGADAMMHAIAELRQPGTYILAIPSEATGVEEVLNIGANRCLSRPVDPAALVKEIAEAVNARYR